RPLGVYFGQGTTTILISAITNSIGQLLGGSSNQILYPSVINQPGSLVADLLVTYRKSGLSCDLVWRTFNTVAAGPQAFGLDESNGPVTILLASEWFDAPEPAQTPLPPDPVDGLADEVIQFGNTVLGPGQAWLGSSTQAQPGPGQGIPVYKSWLQNTPDQNGALRTVLLEEIPYERLEPQFQLLSAAAEGGERLNPKWKTEYGKSKMGTTEHGLLAANSSARRLQL